MTGTRESTAVTDAHKGSPIKMQAGRLRSITKEIL